MYQQAVSYPGWCDNMGWDSQSWGYQGWQCERQNQTFQYGSYNGYSSNVNINNYFTINHNSTVRNDNRNYNSHNRNCNSNNRNYNSNNRNYNNNYSRNYNQRRGGNYGGRRKWHRPNASTYTGSQSWYNNTKTAPVVSLLSLDVKPTADFAHRVPEVLVKMGVRPEEVASQTRVYRTAKRRAPGAAPAASTTWEPRPMSAPVYTPVADPSQYNRKRSRRDDDDDESKTPAVGSRKCRRVELESSPPPAYSPYPAAPPAYTPRAEYRYIPSTVCTKERHPGCPYRTGECMCAAERLKQRLDEAGTPKSLFSFPEGVSVAKPDLKERLDKVPYCKPSRNDYRTVVIYPKGVNSVSRGPN